MICNQYFYFVGGTYYKFNNNWPNNGKQQENNRKQQKTAVSSGIPTWKWQISALKASIHIENQAQIEFFYSRISWFVESHIYSAISGGWMRSEYWEGGQVTEWSKERTLRWTRLRWWRQRRLAQELWLLWEGTISQALWTWLNGTKIKTWG